MRIILLSLIVLIVSSLQAPAQVGCYGPVETDFLNQVNGYRRNNSKRVIIMDPDLCKLAQEWADQLARENKRYHRPGLLTICKESGYKFMNENLHQTGKEVKANEVVYSWMMSKKGHRQNLLHDSLERMGVGFAKSKTGQWFVVWNGAGPKSGIQTKKAEPVKEESALPVENDSDVSSSIPFANPIPKR
jgi:hypothetical protein